MKGTMNRGWLWVLVVILALVLGPALLPVSILTPLNYIGLHALICLGLVLLTGMAGLTSFGQAAFVGLGAYTSAARDDVWLESLGFFTRRIARIRRQCLFAGLANHYLVESLSGAGYDGLGYQSLSSVWEYQRPGGL
mgnify:CR=1 FL=1